MLRLLARLQLGLILVLVSSSLLQATNGTWTDATSGGLWSATGNWASGVVANGTDAVADFSSLNITADNTVHLNVPEIVGSMVFADTTASHNWFLDNNGNNANGLTLAVASGSPTISVIRQFMQGPIITQATISASLSGTQGLTKNGSGDLILTGANTYSGVTTVNVGTLIVKNSGIPTASTVLNSTLRYDTSAGDIQQGPTTFTGAGTLIKDNANQVVFGGTGDVNWNLSPGAMINVLGGTFVGGSSNNDNWAGNSASLNIAAGASFTGVEADVRIDALTGAGSFTGGYLFNQGSVTIGFANGSGTFSGSLQDTNTSLSLLLALTKAGTGTQIFTGASTYTRGTTVSGGILQLGDGTSSNGSIIGNVLNNATLAFANPSVQTFSGQITGTGNVTKSGAGTLTLSGANSYSGPTAINAGTLAIVGGLSSAGNINVGASGTTGQSGALNIDSGATVSQTGQAAVTVGAIANSTGTLNIGLAALGGSLTTGSGGLTINNSSAVTIGTPSIPALLSVMGNIVVNGGMLNRIGSSTLTLAVGKSFTVQNSGAFNFSNAYTTAVNSVYTITGQNSTFHGTAVLPTDMTLNVDFGAQFKVLGGAAATFDGTVFIGETQNAGSISVDGDGTLFSAGNLTLVNSTDSLSVTNGASLNVSGTLGNKGTIMINGGNVFAADAQFVGNGASFIAGSFGTGDDLKISSTGILVISAKGGNGPMSTDSVLAANRQLTTSGTTTIDAGQSLTLAGGTLSTGNLISSGTLTFASGTLDITGANGLTIGSGPLGSALILNSGCTLNVTNTTAISSGASLTINGGTMLTGPITSSGSLVMTSGSLTASALTSNAVLTINGGTLTATGANGVTISPLGLVGSTATVNSGGTLNVVNTTTISNGTTLNIAGGNFISTNVSNSGLAMFNGTVAINSAATNNVGATIDVTGGSFATAALNNSGLVTLDGGTFRIAGALTNNSGGLVYISANKNVSLGSASTNAGEIELGGADAQLAGAGTLANTGFLHGDGVIANGVTNNFGGEIRAEATHRIEITGVSGANAGLVNLQGGTAEFSKPLTNGATGQILGRGTLMVGGTGLTNLGSIAFSAGITDIFGDINNNTLSGSLGVTVSGNSNTTFWGDVTNTSGLFRVSSGSAITVFGTYSGLGISGAGNVYYEADVSPGFSPASVSYGGNVSLDTTAKLKIELGGTTPGAQFDQIHVAGQLSLNGMLAISLINGFVPTSGQSFKILDWGALNGRFASIQLPALTAPLGWNLSQLYATGVIEASAFLPGDINRDGQVTVADVAALMTALSDLNGYQSLHPDLTDSQLLRDVVDINGDGVINSLDVQSLISLISNNTAAGTGGSIAAVPEPPADCLYAIGVASIALAWRFRYHQTTRVIVSV